jgi:NADPH-dependent curcumin reductase CurA
MIEHINRAVHLARRPVGEPVAEDFELRVHPRPAVVDGQFLVRVHDVSLDPAMRGWMREQRAYIDPVELNAVMRAGGAGEVIESRHADFAVGDQVSGLFGVQDLAISDGTGITRIDLGQAPRSAWLNALGMPGMTAYFGLLDIGQPQPGQTVVVSGAVGAVGATVGQIAKIVGCRVVGIAGGGAKCRVAVEEFGFDACIDYKAGNLRTELKAACPNGIDVYFDNVGGDILDTVLTQLAMKARVVLCGAISQYNRTGQPKGPDNYLAIILYRARMEGMVVFDYVLRFAEGVAAISEWMKAGKLVSREHVVDGIDNFYPALMMLFRGQNTGKLVLRIGDTKP